MHGPAELILLRVAAPIELHAELRPHDRSIARPGDIAVGPYEQAAHDLVTCAANLRREQITAIPMVVTGHVAEAIVDEAARREVDIIVMATHGYGGLRRWALGSVADKVLHATTTPLVLVRAQ
jgi:nucleotide-binding universal stress UspA family protein